MIAKFAKKIFHVFYALKYPKFTTITFWPSTWRLKPATHIACLTALPLLDRMRILATKILGTSMKLCRVLEYEIQKKIDLFFKTLI